MPRILIVVVIAMLSSIGFADERKWEHKDWNVKDSGQTIRYYTYGIVDNDQKLGLLITPGNCNANNLWFTLTSKSSNLQDLRLKTFPAKFRIDDRVLSGSVKLGAFKNLPSNTTGLMFFGSNISTDFISSLEKGGSISIEVSLSIGESSTNYQSIMGEFSLNGFIASKLKSREYCLEAGGQADSLGNSVKKVNSRLTTQDNETWMKLQCGRDPGYRLDPETCSDLFDKGLGLKKLEFKESTNNTKLQAVKSKKSNAVPKIPDFRKVAPGMTFEEIKSLESVNDKYMLSPSKMHCNKQYVTGGLPVFMHELKNKAEIPGLLSCDKPTAGSLNTILSGYYNLSANGITYTFVDSILAEIQIYKVASDSKEDKSCSSFVASLQEKFSHKSYYMLRKPLEKGVEFSNIDHIVSIKHWRYKEAGLITKSVPGSCSITITDVSLMAEKDSRTRKVHEIENLKFKEEKSIKDIKNEDYSI